VRNNAVHIVGPDQRLKRVPIEIEFLQADIAVIKSGLSGGEQVVVTDLIPAIPGMLLDPLIDAVLTKSLKAAGAAL
jgi:hypothetical protein